MSWAKELLVAALSLLLVGCGEGKTLQFNLMSEAVQLDWNRAIDSTSVILIDNIMEGLTTYSDSMQGSRADLIRPMPALAKSWSVSEGGKVYTFYLREGVVWGDGVPLEAKHFVDSWERLLSPSMRTSNAYHLYDIENAQNYSEGRIKDFSKVGVKAINEHTLVVTLRHPVPYFLHLVASASTFPIRRDLMQKYGSQWLEPENLVTLGAYHISEWTHGERIVLTRNKEYWSNKPEIDRVVCRLISEPLAALALYENGELDIIPRDFPSSYAKRLQTHPDYRTGYKLSVSYLVFNTRRAPFDKAAARKAFIQGMNRALFASYFQGSQSPTKSWIPPGMIGFQPDLGIVADGSESNIISPATIEIRYSGNDTWNLLFQSMQHLMEEKLHLRAKLDALEWRDYREFISQLSGANRLKSSQIPHIFSLSWVADYPDSHSFMNVFTSTSESNYTGWKNSKYDDLIAQAVATENEDTRGALYSEAQKLLLEEEAVIMPLFFTSHQALVRSNLKGVTLNALDKWYFQNIRFEDDSWGISLKKSILRRLSGGRGPAGT